MGTDELKWSVYIHTTPDGRRYIGITSWPAEKRWANGRGYEGCHFYNAIIKYGWDNISHEVIATNLSGQDAKAKEIDLIAEYMTTNPLYGYNRTLGGEGVRENLSSAGFNPRTVLNIKNNIHVLKTRYKILPIPKRGSAKHKVHGLSKPVLQCDKSSGNVINEFHSAAEVTRELGISAATICRVCRGKRRTAGGYTWKFKNCGD